MLFASIDTKIMLHRATDFAKDASLLHKKGDIVQSYMTKHTNETVKLQQTTVQETQKKDENVIKREKEKKKQRENQKPQDTGKRGKAPKAVDSGSAFDIRI